MSDESGLSSAEAQSLLAKHGQNKLPEIPPPTKFQLLIEQFKSPLVYVLLGAMVISALLQEYGDALVIGFAVILNTVLGFFQEAKASNALQALKSLIHPKALVIRDGKQMQVNVEDVVPGDIAILNTGEKVPADGVLIDARHFLVTESILTGEAAPVSKSNGDKVFMGTVASAGRAYMKVETTGAKTEIGKIALSVQEVSEETPLKKQLAAFSKQLTYLVIGLTFFVFVVGLLTGRNWAEVFITSVALAVSAIPEGLLVALTAVLAIGMQRILRRKGLVRNLVSAETLGGVTTICTDKTGTLTEGKLQVVEAVGDKNDLALQSLLTSDLDDPIVVAAWDWARRIFSDAGGQGRVEKLLRTYPRLDELPFSSKTRFSATLHKFGEGTRIYVNGAPEYVLSWTKLSKDKQKEVLAEIEQYTKQGMRVVGMATKKTPLSKQTLNEKDVRQGLAWQGLLVFSDPIRKGVKQALVKTSQAGIRTIVITGDYKDTALFVLKNLGVEVKEKMAVTGDELAKLSSSELRSLLKNKETMLFARTDPEQKLKIVEALKDNGEVVAMTGDGVNDAPALAKSDIGIVVESATDVAKESSDLVLLDSSFNTIVAAVEEGRTTFDNIRKIILYLLADAFEEIIAVVLVVVTGATLIPGLPLPVSAAQVLYINLISDGFPNLALTVDPRRKESMSLPPRDPNEKLVNRWVRETIFIVSLTGGIVAFAIYTRAFLLTYDIEIARSVAFATLGINSLVYVFSVRTLTKPFWTDNPLNNPWLILAVIGGVILQIIPFVIGSVGRFFDIVPIPFQLWAEAIGASILMFVIIEFIKWVYRKNASYIDH